MDPSQWNAYYGYGQGYEAYGYGAAQDPSSYTYGAYGAYGGYQQYPSQQVIHLILNLVYFAYCIGSCAENYFIDCLFLG